LRWQTALELLLLRQVWPWLVEAVCLEYLQLIAAGARRVLLHHLTRGSSRAPAPVPDLVHELLLPGWFGLPSRCSVAGAVIEWSLGLLLGLGAALWLARLVLNVAWGSAKVDIRTPNTDARVLAIPVGWPAAPRAVCG
jgi:hypothetical protein